MLKSLARTKQGPPAAAAPAADMPVAAPSPRRWTSLPTLLRTGSTDTDHALLDAKKGKRSKKSATTFDAGTSSTPPPAHAHAAPSIAESGSGSGSNKSDTSTRARRASLAHRARGSVKSAFLGVRSALTFGKYTKHQGDEQEDEGIASVSSPPPPRIDVALVVDHDAENMSMNEDAGNRSSLADACFVLPPPSAPQVNAHAAPYPGYGAPRALPRSDSALATSTLSHSAYSTSVPATHAHAPHGLLAPIADDETGDDVTPFTSPRGGSKLHMLPRSTSHPAMLAPPRSRSHTGAPLTSAVAASRNASRMHSRAPTGPGVPLLFGMAEGDGERGSSSEDAVAHAAAWAELQQQLAFRDAGVASAADAAKRVMSPKLSEEGLDWDWAVAADAMPELVSDDAAVGASAKAKEAEAAAAATAGKGAKSCASSAYTVSAAGTLLPAYAAMLAPSAGQLALPTLVAPALGAARVAASTPVAVPCDADVGHVLPSVSAATSTSGSSPPPAYHADGARAAE